jgi:hypothetical protein
LGNPTDFHLAEGQAHDLEGADVFLKDFEAETLLADKAFDADERVLKNCGKKALQQSFLPKAT